MTAVIGILNKSAVAIAADSAATITSSNGRKIYNTANKIFRLSKFHPVGISIYNSANFMSTPWEIIIKEYRRQLGDKSFPILENYQADFFEYLNSRNFFSSDDDLILYLKSFCAQTLESLIGEIVLPPDFNTLANSNQNDLINKLIINKLNESILNIKQLTECKSLESVEFDKFKAYYSTHFEILIKERFDFPFYETTFETFLELLFLYFKSSQFMQYTGLIFIGYGEIDFYPKCISCNVGEVVLGHLRYSDIICTKISDSNSSAILPFAQRDVIDTIITGINPSLQNLYGDLFERFLTEYNAIVVKTVEKENRLLSKKIAGININNLRSDFDVEVRKYISANNIIPTYSTISLLSKEDLAEMAESLIYLTYLKRRISFEEESVGGPVDVAIISKGDGFIWIKRKHYFDEKLNPHFFKNYNLM
jgi:hypothetical protein